MVEGLGGIKQGSISSRFNYKGEIKKSLGERKICGRDGNSIKFEAIQNDDHSLMIVCDNEEGTDQIKISVPGLIYYTESSRELYEKEEDFHHSFTIERRDDIPASSFELQRHEEFPTFFSVYQNYNGVSHIESYLEDLWLLCDWCYELYFCETMHGYGAGDPIIQMKVMRRSYPIRLIWECREQGERRK